MIARVAVRRCLTRTQNLIPVADGLVIFNRLVSRQWKVASIAVTACNEKKFCARDVTHILGTFFLMGLPRLG